MTSPSPVAGRRRSTPAAVPSPPTSTEGGADDMSGRYWIGRVTDTKGAGVGPTGIPDEVHEVLERFLCCEFTTIARDGTPLTWPVVALYGRDRADLVLSTSIGFPVKAAHIRREPRVSLLFSDPTGSGLDDPPAVLLQGTATVSDDVRTWDDDLGAHWRLVSARQPISRWFSRFAPGRWFMDWYYMRLVIHVVPQTVSWWAGGDTAVAPQVVTVDAR